MNILRRFYPLFRPYYQSSVFLGIILVIHSFLTIATPFLYQLLIDRGIVEQSVRTVIVVIGAIAFSMLAQEALFLGQTKLILRMREQIFSALKQRLYVHLMRLPQSFYSDEHKGRMLSRLTYDVNAIQSLFLDRLVFFLRNTLVGVLILVILLYMQWKMVLLSALFLPLLVILYLKFRKKISALSAQNYEWHDALAERLHEDLAVVKAIQSFSVSNTRMDETLGMMKHAESTRRKLDLAYSTASSSTVLLNLIGLIAIWGIGAVEVMENRMTMGTLVAISFFLNYIIRLFYSAYYTVLELQSAIQPARRIFEVLDAEAVIADGEGAVDMEISGMSIALERVTFAYPASDPILSDVNLQLHPGDIVGIIGDSGEGKTTLANLLQRFLDPRTGRIAIGGTDIRMLRLENLRKRVVAIPQDDLLFNDSLRNNITMNRPGISDAQFQSVCRLAKVDQIAAHMADGYDTVIGERGAKLSGGQKKRVAIARALLEDPDVLILDEATSMLDEDTEQAILDSIFAHAQRKIVIMITHKQANLRYANRVFRLHRGKLESVLIPSAK